MPSFIMRRLPALMLAGSLIGLVALAVLPGWAPFLMRFEHQTADWRTKAFSDAVEGEHPSVAVVLVSEVTLDGYPYLLPADRGLLAKVVRGLDAAGAKVVGLDFYFSRTTEPAKDNELKAALRDVGAKIVLGALDERGRLSDRQREIQDSFIRESNRPAGFINLRTEPDGIVRFRAGPADGSKWPASFAELSAAAGGADNSAIEAPIAWLTSPDDESPAFLTLPAEALVDGTAAHEAAAKRGDIARLKGKTVLIGGDYAYLDRHATPMSGKGKEAGPGVFVHAHDVAQRLDGRVMHELGPRAVSGVIAGVAVVAALLGWLLGVRHEKVAGWTVATGILVAADALVFGGLRTILPFSLLLVAWVLGATAGRMAHILFMQRQAA